MTLEDLGYNSFLENYRKENNLFSFDVGRIISEHKERYIVKTEMNELEAEVIGNLRFSAENRYDFPAVGDWVAISEYDECKALIHAIYPRKTIIERQAVGKTAEKQIIATNIDYSFIVQAVDRDFNINRVERYLTICNAAGIKSILVISKIDLIDESQLNDIFNNLKGRIDGLPIVPISNKTQIGYTDLTKYIIKGHTYCLLGSSGVGKSTLVNNFVGNTLMQTDTLSLSTGKGKHVTSHRELIMLENGGILIDNPGMREVGITETADGIISTFDDIEQLSQNCRFKDCRHLNEDGCAVFQAVEEGKIARDSYNNYMKMERERRHFESSIAEKRKRDKEFGKVLKNYKRFKKENE